MSRYAANRVLWEVTADGDLARALREHPQATLAGRDLTAAEREALAAADVRALFALGVHPFLLYHFALRLAGGFSLPFVRSYVERLQGLQPGDVQT